MDIFEKILEYRKLGTPFVLVTAVEKEGFGPVEVGKKMIVTQKGDSFGTVGGGKLEYYAIEKAKTLFTTRRPLLERYALTESEIHVNAKVLPMACGGIVTLYYEYQGALADVIIFGGGHVGQALTNVLKTMNFHVRVIDEREAIAQKVTGADQVFHQGFVSYIEEHSIDDGAYVVICTPAHEHDYHVMNKIIEMNLHPAYVGMLCSPQKLNDYLEKTYAAFGKSVDLSRFYAPIGLDLGGNTPEEIAISITAEILSDFHKKDGKHMRESRHGQYRYWENS